MRVVSDNGRDAKCGRCEADRPCSALLIRRHGVLRSV